MFALPCHGLVSSSSCRRCYRSIHQNRPQKIPTQTLLTTRHPHHTGSPAHPDQSCPAVTGQTVASAVMCLHRPVSTSVASICTRVPCTVVEHACARAPDGFAGSASSSESSKDSSCLEREPLRLRCDVVPLVLTWRLRLCDAVVLGPAPPPFSGSRCNATYRR